MKRLFISLFFILSVVHLLGITAHAQTALTFSKPALIPTLALWFWLSTTPQAGKIRYLFLIGLLFSTAGDVFLMNNGATYFLLGLSSFLIAHVFYIITFFYFPEFKKGLVIRRPAIIIPVAMFLGVFLFMLLPKVPEGFQVPVLVYSMVIALMILSAINLTGRTSATATKTVISGAILFLISDSILGSEKFNVLTATNANLIRFAVMFTYLSGQYLLTKGMVRQLTANEFYKD